ncbi:hypothetical protein [Herbiconiux sp. L3-i23]|uniref:hypothetical protein n=1 Tax=Herbiconiux sp. L3-i23 TaxID=2905871 RepID=UPI00206F69FF|nr:hypothetical protein [Herbiconiux sp. L3-i23]BDI22805.1 hypothetical protein L3i23_15810 [Herbiconiux sp. L3-i23]
MRVPDVLTENDFAIAELCALRLDGGAIARGDGYLAVDAIEDPALRAATLASSIPAPRVADRATAAWIWGARVAIPRPIEVCVGRGLSNKVDALRGMQLREATLASHDTVELGGIAVTTPRRTALDLLRGPAYSPATEETVRALLRMDGSSIADLLPDLTETRFQRERIRARERMRQLGAA